MITILGWIFWGFLGLLTLGLLLYGFGYVASCWEDWLRKEKPE